MKMMHLYLYSSVLYMCIVYPQAQCDTRSPHPPHTLQHHHTNTDSYKTAVLHPSVQPSLAARIARKPSQPHTYTLDASRR